MNTQLVDHLKQISHLFLKSKDQWRSRAFSKVAGELERMPSDLEFANGQLVTAVPGVGDAIKSVIEQFIVRGTSDKFEVLKQKLPNEVVERFDAKVCKRKVNELLQPLTDAGVDWGYAGSMRRGSPTVRDVDVVVCLKDEAAERALIESVLAKAGLTPDVRNGHEKIGVSIPIKSQGRSFTLDLNFTHPDQRGAMYLYFTGPKANNIALRGKAKAMGLRLNQNGLFKDGICIASRTEEEILNALGEKYVEPSDRA